MRTPLSKSFDRMFVSAILYIVVFVLHFFFGDGNPLLTLTKSAIGMFNFLSGIHFMYLFINEAKAKGVKWW